jgi:hypothetical protein
MGFTFKIGQLTTIIEEGRKQSHVEDLKHDEAPADGSPTDYTNSRWPSYTGWGEFCDDLEIDPDYLVPDHPGYKKIDREFKALIDDRYEKFKGDELHGGRIAWMKYWTDWAIENCSKPVLLNR